MKNRIINFFSQSDINVSRQKNIDYAKAISIIFMIFIHVLMSPEYFHLKTTPFGRIADVYLGGFMAAPVFMAAMGVGLTFTRQGEPNQIIIRGIKFFFLSFALNIVRSLALAIHLIVSHADNFAAHIIFEFFSGDILGFVGLALILFGLLKKFKYHKVIIPSIALIFSIIITAVPRIYTDNDILGYTIGYIFPIGHTTIAGGAVEENLIGFFPLMSWFSVVAFGYVFGLIIRKVKNLDRFYLYAALIGVILFVPILVTEVVFGYGEMNKNATELEAYMKTLPDLIMSIGFILIDFALWHLVGKFTNEKIDKFFFTMSNAINEIYIISWVLIMNVDYMILAFTIERAQENIWIYMVTFLITFLISLVLGILWKQLKVKHRKKKQLVTKKT